MLVPHTWAEEQERGQHCIWRGTCACQQICCCSVQPQRLLRRAERRRSSVCSAGLLCALCSTLCIVSLTGSPGADRVTHSCCLDACSNNGEMGRGWREVEWNSVYANSCHLQDWFWTGLESTCDLLFKSWISKGRRIITIPSFSHPDFQSNWKMYLMSPSLRE